MNKTARQVLSAACAGLFLVSLAQADPAASFESQYGKNSSPVQPAQGNPLTNQGQNRIARAYISDGDGTAVVRRRPVVVGEELTSDGLEVRDGLVVGELVVTAGARRLADGLKVSLLGEEP